MTTIWIPFFAVNNSLWVYATSVGIALCIFIAALAMSHILWKKQDRTPTPRHELIVPEQSDVMLDEQEIVLQQQREVLSELDYLYCEQARVAVTDAITNLPNHRAVMVHLDEEISRCRRAHTSCSLLFIDLDHFKQVNDTLGHRAGDALLYQVGNRLRTAIRLEDFVGRYGGEEFAIMLVETNLDEAKETAERLRKSIAEEPYYWQAEETEPPVPLFITASIGIAIYQLHGQTREELIDHADRAMYLAKRIGRNRVCIAAIDVLDSNGQVIVSPPNDEGEIEIATVQALATAASAHDRGTDAHAQRMVQLAEATGHILQLSKEEIYLLRLATILHDIGKIGVPDAILHKPGPLTDDEREIIRRHPEIGQQILIQLGGVFGYLSDIVVAHHERWDGGGYPTGMSKDAIPLTARILSVIDSYDAMISQRPYRDPLSVDDAKAELVRCAGSQYDPYVVKAFINVLAETAKRSNETEQAQLLPAA